jgi:hypothetical protein
MMKKITLVFILLYRALNISAQADISDSLVTVRLRIIETLLEQGKSNANIWWYGWLAGYSAATVGQGAVCLSTGEKGLKQDMAVGAGTTFLGAAGQLLTPMVPGYASEQLQKISEDTREARLQKLKKAEELLKKSALREIQGRSWIPHAVAGVVNVSSGLITWFGFKRDVWAGVENFALNTVITEAQIWTQPIKAIRDYNSYCQKFKSDGTLIVMKPEITWFVSATPGGFSLRIMF